MKSSTTYVTKITFASAKLLIFLFFFLSELKIDLTLSGFDAKICANVDNVTHQ